MGEAPTLIHILTANRWGGIQRYALDICRHFKENGWQVFALTRGAKAVDSLFEDEGINLMHAPFEGLLDPVSIRLLTKKIRTSPGQVVIHAHSFRKVCIALIAKKLSRRKDVKVVVTRHKVKHGIDSWLFRNIYRNVDSIVFVSRIARDKFLETWKNFVPPFPDSRLHIVHNSIKLPKGPFLPVPESGPTIAMFHGPLEPGKGLETLIDAMVLLRGKRIRLRIVGSGQPDYTDKIRRRAISKGVMDLIDWYGHTDDPFPLIQSSDFGVLPATEAEAFGLSNIEFMALGRPQICSSNGAQPEYISDGVEGFLVKPGNPSSLAEKMMSLAGDPSLKDKMGRNAYESFNSRLSWPIFAERINSIYL
ncbi:MAG: glycosyltransferase family 4 protein [Muribaculaceae bacterium]|nr:glycosyltransferase family 4 protein [Muribaculaceae bacterium]